MTAQKIKLISPENEDIVGLLLEDGSTCPVVLMYDKDLLVQDIILQEIVPSPPKKISGQSVYVDKNGKQWNSLDVEYHSILKPKFLPIFSF
jgi:hypothetical protein